MAVVAWDMAAEIDGPLVTLELLVPYAKRVTASRKQEVARCRVTVHGGMRTPAVSAEASVW